MIAKLQGIFPKKNEAIKNKNYYSTLLLNSLYLKDYPRLYVISQFQE